VERRKASSSREILIQFNKHFKLVLFWDKKQPGGCHHDGFQMGSPSSTRLASHPLAVCPMGLLFLQVYQLQCTSTARLGFK
jgi:hypothetical protein